MTESRQVQPNAGPFEVFPNPAKQHDNLIRHHVTEFTSMCPVTGHPDFGEILIELVADEVLVELKSLKLWLFSFRQRGIYYEAATNEIADTIFEYLQPRFLRVTSHFKGRGGIQSSAVAVRSSYEGDVQDKMLQFVNSCVAGSF